MNCSPVMLDRTVTRLQRNPMTAHEVINSTAAWSKTADTDAGYRFMSVLLRQADTDSVLRGSSFIMKERRRKMAKKKEIVQILCLVMTILIFGLLPENNVFAADNTSDLENLRKNRVYIGNYDMIWAVNLKTKHYELLKRTAKENKRYPVEIPRIGNMLYYDNGYNIIAENQWIYGYDLDDRKEGRLAFGFNPLVYNDHVYYICYYGDMGLYRMNPDGSGKKNIIPFDYNHIIKHFCINNGSICYTEKDDYKALFKADINGKNKKKVYDFNSNNMISMYADGKNVYVDQYYSKNTNRIFRYNTEKSRVDWAFEYKNIYKNDSDGTRLCYIKNNCLYFICYDYYDSETISKIEKYVISKRKTIRVNKNEKRIWRNIIHLNNDTIVGFALQKKPEKNQYITIFDRDKDTYTDIKIR